MIAQDDMLNMPTPKKSAAAARKSTAAKRLFPAGGDADADADTPVFAKKSKPQEMENESEEEGIEELPSSQVPKEGMDDENDDIFSQSII